MSSAVAAGGRSRTGSLVRSETEASVGVDQVVRSTLECLDLTALSVAPLDGGKNNRVYRVDLDSGPVLAKAYFQDPRDRRGRLQTESGMLRFLWDNGVRGIPQPLAVDLERNVGFYTFVQGRRPAPEDLDSGATEALARLLIEMWELRQMSGAEAMGAASEACHRLADHVRILDRRLDRLHCEAAEDGPGESLREFLSGELGPAVQEVERNLVSRDGFDRPLPSRKLTLSPSDHGFHNALITPDGGWVFLDFEYSGRDDPAKMIADACLQPAVPIPTELGRQFVSDMLRRLGGETDLARRLRLIYPAVGLKWCLIFLNEFLPVGARRRLYSRTSERPVDRRPEQLDLARKMLRHIQDPTVWPI